MKVHYKIEHIPEVENVVTVDVQSATERKLLTLKKYLAKTDEVTQVYVELGKEHAAQTGNIWRAEINLDSLGKRHHAKVISDSIQNAIDSVIQDLEAELRKSKTKDQNMFRRGGAAIKSEIREEREI